MCMLCDGPSRSCALNGLLAATLDRKERQCFRAERHYLRARKPVFPCGTAIRGARHALHSPPDRAPLLAPLLCETLHHPWQHTIVQGLAGPMPMFGRVFAGCLAVPCACRLVPPPPLMIAACQPVLGGVVYTGMSDNEDVDDVADLDMD